MNTVFAQTAKEQKQLEKLNSLRENIITQYKSNDLESAYRNTLKYITLSKKNSPKVYSQDALYLKAKTCIELKKYNEAEKTIFLLIETCSGNVDYFETAKDGFHLMLDVYESSFQFDKIPQLLCQYIDYTYDGFGKGSYEFENLCMRIINYIEYYRSIGKYALAINITNTIIYHFEEKKIVPYLPISVYYSTLSILYMEVSKPKEALNSILQAINIRKECMQESYYIDPTFSVNLGLAYYALSNYDLAEIHCKEALMNLHLIPNVTDNELLPLRTSILASLSGIYLKKREYSKAEKYGLESIHLSSDNKSVFDIHALINMSVLYSDLGNFEKALEYSNKALSFLVENNMENTNFYITTLQNKALILSNMKSYEESVACYLEVIEFFNRNEINNFLNISVQVAVNIGSLCNELGDYEKAREYFESAINIIESHNIQEQTAYIEALTNLSITYGHLRDMQAAEHVSVKSLEYLKNKDYIYNYFPVFGNAAFVFHEIGKEEEAKQLFLKYFYGIEEQVFTNWLFMTASQRNIFWSQKCIGYDYIHYLSYYADYNDTTFLKQAYNSSLFSKGLLLNSSIELDKIILESQDSLLIETFTSLKQVVRVQEKTGTNMSSEIERLEKELINLSKPFGDYTQNLKLNWNDVQAKLSPNDIAIEFVDFSIPETDSLIYAALILKKDWPAPKMVPLFENKQLAKLIPTGVKEDVKAERTYSGFTGKQISNLIWQPLSEYLDEGSNVYFSPSGVLHQLAIESLPLEDGRLASEKYNLYRLSSTKQLCYERPEKKYNKAVLYGGLKYDLEDEVMVAQSRAYTENRDHYSMRGFESDTAYRGSCGYLSGSKKEVENISSTLTKNGIKTVVFKEENGNEESFRTLSGGKNDIIHIATHGFFLPLEKARKKEYFSMLGDHTPVVDNSMRRSGLIMSGGNRAWEGQPIPEDVEDGVLTSQEIMSLDLRGADLVVLSACETGLGEVSGEGVFGLQRAFKKAGAQTLIMTLWKVSDEATQFMMSKFYSHLLSDNSKREAFLKAQAATKAKYTNPYYWAGFIMLD